MEIIDIYRKLKVIYNSRAEEQWSLWCKRPKTLEEKETVMIESILTQRANWKNVVLAVENLERAGILSMEKILACDFENLELLIRPSGFYRLKTQRLKVLADFILNGCGGIKQAENIATNTLRSRLLALKGVGEETSDDILLYAFERPVFVIDEYTRRLAKELKLTDDFSYVHLQQVFEQGLGRKNYALYQDFHALIVIDGKVKNRGG